MDDFAGMDCDLSHGRNQSIQILSYEENEATQTDLDSASSPPLFSVVYGGDGILFLSVINRCNLDVVLGCFNNLIFLRFDFVLVIRVCFNIGFDCVLSNVGTVIDSVMGFLCLGRFPFDSCSKRGADFLQQILMLRRLLRRDRWLFNRRALCFPSGKVSVRPAGMVSVRTILSMSAIYILPQAATTVLVLQYDPMNLSSPILFFVFLALDLIVLGLVIKVKTAAIPSRLA